MKRRHKILAVTSGLIIPTVVLGLFATKAFAYQIYTGMSRTSVLYKAYGTYDLSTSGDEVKVINPGPYAALNKQYMYAAEEQATVLTPSGSPDGKGEWPVLLADIQGQTANNGYLFVVDPSDSNQGNPTNVSQWISRLGGNSNFVTPYLQSKDKISVQDKANFNTINYDAFAQLVSLSGAKFGPTTYTPLGTSYGAYPEYMQHYTIDASAPPTANSITVSDASTQTTGTVTQGDSIQFSLNSTVPLWSGLAYFHYDGVQITNNATGQSTWVTTQQWMNGINSQSESGGRGMALQDSVNYPSSNLSAGTYTAKFWVTDGVHRTSPSVSTTFTVAPANSGGSGSGSTTGTPTVTLSANPIQLPTSQSTTLTATATNVPSGDYIQIQDQNADNTLSGLSFSANYQAGETSYTTTATSTTPQNVMYNAILMNTATGQADATSQNVFVQWTNGSAPPPTTPSLSFNPSSSQTVSAGSPVPLSYTTTGWQSGDYVMVVPTNASSTTDTWTASNDTNASGSFTETEYPQNGATSQVSYTALLVNPSGTVLATAHSGQITWTSASPPAPSGTISVTPAPEMVQAGQPVTIGYNTTNWQAGDYVTVTPSGNGTSMWSNASDVNATDQFTEIENPTNGNSVTVSYTMTLYDGAGVPLSHASTQITWGSVKPTISFSASPRTLNSGQSSTLSYFINNLGPGDYVNIVGSGGQNAWNQSHLTSASGSRIETENPINGASTVVSYTATVYNNLGQALDQATAVLTWTSVAPKIALSANPTKMVPGQPSTVMYSVNTQLPVGDYVKITGSGGNDAWNMSNLTTQSQSYTETESPAAGQTTTVTYSATIYASNGQSISHANLTISWMNAWTGSVSLSASPLYLPLGSPTNLVATGSSAIPSGYSLMVKDVSTGQVIGQSGRTPASASYTSYTAQTDQFVAYVWDGYEVVGNNSNTVSVVWSALSLSASSTMLPVNNTSTLTVTGQNVPAGYFLILYDQSTGQVVGYSTTTPYSVTQRQSSPQTDSYIAYMSDQASLTGAYATSNPVTVNWYSVILNVNPTRLPVNQTSTLTAYAQNLPSGYVVDILDQTTNSVIASGQPGATTIQAMQTKNQVETDKYVVQVVQPSNPPIPGLNIPSNTTTYSGPGLLAGNVWIGTYGTASAYAFNGSSWTNDGNPGSTSYLEGNVYDQATNSWYAGTWGSGVYQWQNGQWISIGGGRSDDAMTYDSTNHTIYGLFTNGVEAYANGQWTSLPTTYTGGSWGGITYDRTNNSIIIADTGYSSIPIYNISQGTWTTISGPVSSYYSVIYDDANNSIYVSSGSMVYQYSFAQPQASWTAVGALPGTVFTLGYNAANNTVYAGGGFGIDALSNGSWTSVYSSPGGTVDAMYIYGQSNVADFPYWTFQQLPSYIPNSDFPQQASAASHIGGIWSNGNSNVPNGTNFFMTNIHTSSPGTIYLSVPDANSSGYVGDYEQIFIDGKPAAQTEPGAGGIGLNDSSMAEFTSNTMQIPIQVSAGTHQIVIEALNDNGFGGTNNNPAFADLQVTNGNQLLASTHSPSEWMTTNYINKLPSGWFSGAVGTYHFT